MAIRKEVQVVQVQQCLGNLYNSFHTTEKKILCNVILHECFKRSKIISGVSVSIHLLVLEVSCI